MYTQAITDTHDKKYLAVMIWKPAAFQLLFVCLRVYVYCRIYVRNVLGWDITQNDFLLYRNLRTFVLAMHT